MSLYVTLYCIALPLNPMSNITSSSFSFFSFFFFGGGGGGGVKLNITRLHVVFMYIYQDEENHAALSIEEFSRPPLIRPVVEMGGGGTGHDRGMAFHQLQLYKIMIYKGALPSFFTSSIDS